MLLLLATLALVGSSMGHLCLFNPLQRGSVNATNPGSTDCQLLLTTSNPCGGRNGQFPVEGLRAGSTVGILFQKNVNHYESGNPGNFTVQIGDDRGFDFHELGYIPDDNQPDLTLYTVPIEIPHYAGMAIIRVLYYTNNPQAPPVFVQCSDVEIF